MMPSNEAAKNGGRTGAALRHPFGITLLFVSLVLAAAMHFWPALDPWSSRAAWVLLIGLLAYAATVVALLRSRPEETAPELAQLQAIRRTMEARLAARRAAEGSGRQSELTRILSEAIVQLDKQVAPALRQLLERQQALSSYLSRIEEGILPVPGQDVLGRLQTIRDRQQAAIEECVQQAANAAGTLVALLQEGDDASVAAQARTWAKDLLTLYDAIAEVLRGKTGEEELDELIEQSSVKGPDVSKEPVPSSRDSTDGGVSSDGLPRLVQDALRRLNEPAALSRCELISRIPHTLAAVCSRGGNGHLIESTPLKQSQALREVLGAAIEGLKPANSALRPGSPEALQYSILYEEYVREMSTSSIQVRHSISETTFHRHRREAIAAVARDLQRQEDVRRQSVARRQSET